MAREVAALSEQRLQEIRERCEKATPAPWYSVRDDLDVHPNICADDPRGNPIMVAQIRIGLPKDMGSEEANESFILSARQDIPDLLAELTRSRAALLETIAERDKEREIAAKAEADADVAEYNQAHAEAALLEVERQLNQERLLGGLAVKRAEAAEQKLAEQRWIPVSEKLPENDGEFLTWLIDLDGGDGTMSYEVRRREILPFADGEWGGHDSYTVTHWRELPAAPPLKDSE
jgi:hypothetical protein